VVLFAETLPPEMRQAIETLIQVTKQNEVVSMEDLPLEAREALAPLLALLQAEPWDRAVIQALGVYHAARAAAVPVEQAVAQLQTWAQQARQGEEPGSPWLDAAAFLEALAQHLQGRPLGPIPARYQPLWPA